MIQIKSSGNSRRKEWSLWSLEWGTVGIKKGFTEKEETRINLKGRVGLRGRLGPNLPGRQQWVQVCSDKVWGTMPRTDQLEGTSNWISSHRLSRSKDRIVTLPDVKAYYIATVIKTVVLLMEGQMHTSMGKKIQNPKIDPHFYYARVVFILMLKHCILSLSFSVKSTLPSCRCYKYASICFQFFCCCLYFCFVSMFNYNPYRFRRVGAGSCVRYKSKLVLYVDKLY